MAARIKLQKSGVAGETYSAKQNSSLISYCEKLVLLSVQDSVDTDSCLLFCIILFTN